MYIQKQVTKGYNPYLTMEQNDCATNMDVGLLVLDAGDEYVFNEAEKEIALDLLIGKVSFSYNNETHEASRPDTFHYAAYCLHVCKNTEVKIKAVEHSEIYVQKTDNDRTFDAKLYAPSDIMVQHAGSNGELMGCMQREIQTFFDYESA
ncbi:MAG: 5-deoxy-glucuronate isomerase, partial [Synergistaceae bacterium]|nr:5-deoxy-glucuronate isomerase [Synergistaceae bacterium]